MNIERVLPDFDHEMSLTRRFLERVPMDRADFRPHPKSATLGGLANHLAGLPGLGALMFQGDSLDLRSAPRPAPVGDSEALLASFDGQVAAMRAAVEAASEEQLAAHWRATAGPQVIFDQPRSQLLRGVLSHMIHHRAQLGVYLRLLGVPVPPTYGPSADER